MKVENAILLAWTPRLDQTATLRDAPVPVHACVNHVVDGHCSVCGCKVAPDTTSTKGR
jgi:hypothetical protein